MSIRTGAGNADDTCATHIQHHLIKLAPQSNKANRFVLLLLAVGAAYFVIGYVFGELDDLGVTERGVFLWRLGAWVASGVVFAVHLWLESKRFRNAILRVALHASLGVAFGAFLLAVNAAFHAAWITATAPFRRFSSHLLRGPCSLLFQHFCAL